MTDSSSSIPPSDGKKPDLNPPNVKPEKIAPKPEPLSGDTSLEYMGFQFSSEKDLETFRAKFLATMVNTMMSQIKRDQKKMEEALKKLNPNNQQ